MIRYWKLLSLFPPRILVHQVFMPKQFLNELRLYQLSPTVIYVDNKGAYNIAQQGQPTKNSKHIDIRHFAIQDWVEKDLISIESVKTTSNVSDSLSKATQKQLFHRHFDFIMGKIPPSQHLIVNSLSCLSLPL